MEEAEVKDEQIKDLPQTSDATDASKMFSCAICQKTFTRKYHLDRHLRISRCSGMPVPSFPCELCNRVYTRKVKMDFFLLLLYKEILSIIFINF